MLAVTAQHTDLVVEAHGVLAVLILVSALQPNIEAALQFLVQALQAPVRVVFSTAPDVLRLGAQVITSGTDICIGLKVSILATRTWEIHIKPLRPGTARLAAVCWGRGRGSSGG